MKKLCAVAALAMYAPIDAAQSLQRCTSHEKMIELLTQRYSEVPKAVGLVDKKRVMEVFVSKTGTWTILVTNSEGQTCMLAAGQAYEDVPVEFSGVEPKT